MESGHSELRPFRIELDCIQRQDFEVPFPQLTSNQTTRLTLSGQAWACSPLFRIRPNATRGPGDELSETSYLDTRHLVDLD
jgi:hypothetical protein